jgi:glyoxylase-like metal-dependent hydrolase (beta-lactamase superfamily II)
MVMQIQTFFDKRTFTLTYVVFDPKSRDAVVIDPVLDYEPASSTTFTESADEVIRFVKDNQLTLHYVLETHAHADHLSGSQRIKEHFPKVQVAIGSRITVVQKTFKQVFDLPDEFATDGRQFDRLLGDGETVQAGTLSWKVIFTPGHTPACASYKFGDAVFTGDALFLPDSGTGRCDFPAGSAHDLYDSVSERLYALPDKTRVFVGHDYQPGGREVRWESTIADEKQNNIQLRADTTKEQFVHFRNERDKTLNAPKLLFQSVQVNVDGGALPQPNRNEIRYLKIPLNVFKPDAPPEAERQVELRAV